MTPRSIYNSFVFERYMPGPLSSVTDSNDFLPWIAACDVVCFKCERRFRSTEQNTQDNECWPLCLTLMLSAKLL